jgi:methionyl-tRNA formyltransferase
VLKYIFMGTPPFAATILEKLCESLLPPVAVVTQVSKATGRGHKIQSSAVEAYAKSQELNVLETLDVNASHTLDVLKTFHPDLVLVAAFGQILKTEVLTLPKLYCLNVHGSLLPKYRGAAPVQRAIWDGEKITGVTIQKMAKKLDTGDILLQKQMNIDPHDTSETLMNRMAQLGGEAMLETFRLIEAGNSKFTPQDEKLATYAKKISKEDAKLDWNQPAQMLENQVRALQPWPIAETTLIGDADSPTARIKIFGAQVVAEAGEPGSVSSDGKTRLLIHCGERTALSLTVIQPENRKRIDVKSFLNSFRGRFPYRKADG